MPLLYSREAEAARFARQQKHAWTHSPAIATDLRHTSPRTAAARRSRDPEVRKMAAHRSEPIRSQEFCGRGAVIVAAKDGSKITVVPTRCKTWMCPRCGPVLARLWGDRIADAKPQRFITLTADPYKWPRPDLAYDAMKDAWTALVRLIRQKIGTFEYCLVWELHHSGYPHLHVCQRGKYIPQKWLSRTWLRLGIGQVVDIRSISTRRGAARYATKYMLKTVKATRDAIGLTRVVTASRGFFRKPLIKPSPTNDIDSTTTHTLAHPGDVIEALILRFGWTLQSDPGAAAFVLVPDGSPASRTPLETILATLPER